MAEASYAVTVMFLHSIPVSFLMRIFTSSLSLLQDVNEYKTSIGATKTVKLVCPTLLHNFLICWNAVFIKQLKITCKYNKKHSR